MMDSLEKAKLIQPWINEEERVTVDFVNEKDLNESHRLYGPGRRVGVGNGGAPYETKGDFAVARNPSR